MQLKLPSVLYSKYLAMNKDTVIISYTIYYDDANLRPYREHISIDSSQSKTISKEAEEWIKKVKSGPFNLESNFQITRLSREPVIKLNVNLKATASKVSDSTYCVNMKVDLDCRCRISDMDIKIMDENIPDDTIFDKITEFITGDLPKQLAMSKKDFKSLYGIK